MTDRVELGPLDDDPSNTVKVTGPEKRGEPLNEPLKQEWSYPPNVHEPAQELEVRTPGAVESEHRFFSQPGEHRGEPGLLRKPRTPQDVRREALDNAQVGIDSARSALIAALDWLAIDDAGAADEWDKRLLPEMDLCVEGVTRRRKALDA